jgi:hypothetical protein
LLAVGLVSFVLVRSWQGQGDLLIARQQQARALSAGGVQDAVKRAPLGAGGRRGTSAQCAPLGSGELKNPWRCTIAYASGREVGYTVTINANGSYLGDHQLIRFQGKSSPGPGQISGCCINIP